MMLPVALRKESVDRNLLPLVLILQKTVALRKESVDRNAGKAPYMENAVVALRKESVDRNIQTLILRTEHLTSLSVRRAWIEIASSGVDFAEDWRRSP